MGVNSITALKLPAVVPKILNKQDVLKPFPWDALVYLHVIVLRRKPGLKRYVQNALKKRYNIFQPVRNAFQRAVIILVCDGNVRQRVQNFVGQHDRFQCHAIKNKLKTIQCKALRKCDVIEDK